MGDAAGPFATDDHITLALFVSRQGADPPNDRRLFISDLVSLIPIDPRVWKTTDLLHTLKLNRV